ncbi:MAG: ATP-binding protein [Proteobacteria bacterium]|nr:ATP-binding protein [Pseudomonadota bacterium]
MKSFIKLLAIILIPLSVIMLLAFYFSNSLVIESAQHELLKEMRNKWLILARHTLNAKTPQENARIIREISHNTKLRITIVKLSGIVEDDSYLDREDVPEMENHRNRPEISDAILGDEGYSFRYSITTGMDMIYFARRLGENSVLRIAYPTTYLSVMRQGFTRQNLSIFLFWFGITVIVAVYLARKISLPVQKLDLIARQVEAGKPKIHFPDFQDRTMGKIAGVIYRIYNAMIREQVQLQQEQEKLDHVFSILEEGIILVDDNYNIIHFNAKAVKLLDYELSEVKNLLGDINDPEIISFFRDTLTTDQDKAWKNKKFSNKIFDVNVTIHQNEKLIVFFNVTEERKYQRYKSELVENISHELKTPLAMILGYAETIINDPEMPQEITDRFLKKIYNSSRRINGIINDLLELHRLESMGRKIMPEQAIAVDEVIQDVKSRFADEQSKSLHFNVKAEEMFIHYEHLFSIVANLTDNAVKYSNGDNVYVDISRNGKQIKILVDDEGPQIPADDQERIFERFYTISRSRNRNRAGSGLGLPIVKHICQLYDGNVSVSVGKYAGNRFTVTLKES